MSFTTIIGILSGFALIIVSILLETSKFGIFVSFSSLMMVVGGTIAGTLIGQEARYVILALKGVLVTYKAQKGGRDSLLGEVGKIIDWSYGVQKNGVLALEKEVDTVKDDALMKFGINVILASHTGDTVSSIMQNFSDNAYVRRNIQVDILKTMASLAPAFGMVGTLVGLIIMLANMGDDPAALGAGLAIALTTTLYGVIIAKMVLDPQLVN